MAGAAVLPSSPAVQAFSPRESSSSGCNATSSKAPLLVGFRGLRKENFTLSGHTGLTSAVQSRSFRGRIRLVLHELRGLGKSALDPPRNKKSWKQRHEKFLKPFMLDVFISHKYVHAKVMHRVTSHVVAVATTNAKELRLSLPSLTDDNACKIIGKLLAERAVDAYVFAVKFDLRKNERFEGKLALVVNTIVENGVALV